MLRIGVPVWTVEVTNFLRIRLGWNSSWMEFVTEGIEARRGYIEAAGAEPRKTVS